MYRCEDFPCCGHYDEGGPERGVPYCPNPDDPRANGNGRLFGRHTFMSLYDDYAPDDDDYESYYDHEDEEVEI